MLVSPHPVPAPASMSKNAPNLVPPPPVPAQVSMSKNTPKLVPPPGFSPPPVPVRVSMSKSAPKLVPPPDFPPPPVSVRVSMSKNVPKLVPPPPVPPLGSISARPWLIPWLIPGYKEDEQRETKLKLTPLSRLIAEKKHILVQVDLLPKWMKNQRKRSPMESSLSWCLNSFLGQLLAWMTWLISPIMLSPC
ncbi:hypothetical protein P3S68_000334 [Capsicum galapagoense]